MSEEDRSDAIIVGAGLAGLACATHLARAGRRPLLLEASDAVGGRVRTDRVDGFLLDRGFQVLLTAYPECRAMLDYGALELRPFFPGSLVRFGGRFHRIADPWRRPLAALEALIGPIGGLGDKLRVAGLRRRVRRTSLEEIFARPERSTLEALRGDGFSEAMIERFFRPFLGGVFLDRSLDTSSRKFDFVFKMFAEGDTALPAQGMGALPELLASRLPAASVRTGCAVSRLVEGGVETADGERLRAPAVIVATSGPSAAHLLDDVPAPQSTSTACVYFDAPASPLNAPILALDGDGEGPVNHLCVPSDVAPSYAPEGRALISANVPGTPSLSDPALEAAVRAQLTGWFGEAVREWRHLRTYRIEHALPAEAPPALDPSQRPVRLARGLYVCGDHRDDGSLQGALVSGRRAAEAVLQEAEGGT